MEETEDKQKNIGFTAAGFIVQDLDEEGLLDQQIDFEDSKVKEILTGCLEEAYSVVKEEK